MVLGHVEKEEGTEAKLGETLKEGGGEREGEKE